MSKHVRVGALLEVAMLKKCTPLWREAHLEVLDDGWPESEEEQVGNVKLEEEVTRRSKD